METDRIIQLVRWKEGDTDETRYSDFELVEALNEALRRAISSSMQHLTPTRRQATKREAHRFQKTSLP